MSRVSLTLNEVEDKGEREEKDNLFGKYLQLIPQQLSGFWEDFFEDDESLFG